MSSLSDAAMSDGKAAQATDPMPYGKGPSAPSRRRLFRRAFCFPCDRWTLRRHSHCDETFSALVAREVHP